MEQEMKIAFRNQAEKRTNAVIEKIRILTQCSNRNSFNYDDGDVEKMFEAIDNELKISKARFTSKFSF
ncbi:MAG: hypothetical protein CL778_01100 [Chloroflexi bacterium]|nr:hypothetical protein [Chloroflexota bacterium]|tara:strand:+ start:46976 stop:47179 length:204 start_codon:yes stop_codon:yes gene_type:complete